MKYLFTNYRIILTPKLKLHKVKVDSAFRRGGGDYEEPFIGFPRERENV